MVRANYIILGFFLVLAACTERLACPAYQSAFIYDKNELRKRFSYFQEDSTPKVLTASKTKYLIAEPTPYQKKLRSLQTVPMKKVMVAVPDSISGVKSDSASAAELDKAARSVMDTIMIVDVPPQDTVSSKEDSTYMISKDREVRVLKYNMPDSLEYDPVTNRYVPQKPKYYVDEVGYNTEQDNYMWYMRRSLILPDVRLAKMQQANAKAEAKDVNKAKAKKGPFAFIKNLFKKKKVEDIDSAELDLNKDGEEFDFIDTTQTVVPKPNITQKENQRKNKVSPTDDTESTPVENNEEAVPSRKKRKKDKEVTDQPANVEEQKEEQGDGF